MRPLLGWTRNKGGRTRGQYQWTVQSTRDSPQCRRELLPDAEGLLDVACGASKTGRVLLLLFFGSTCGPVRCGGGVEGYESHGAIEGVMSCRIEEIFGQGIERCDYCG